MTLDLVLTLKPKSFACLTFTRGHSPRDSEKNKSHHVVSRGEKSLYWDYMPHHPYQFWSNSLLAIATAFLWGKPQMPQMPQLPALDLGTATASLREMTQMPQLPCMLELTGVITCSCGSYNRKKDRIGCQWHPILSTVEGRSPGAEACTPAPGRSVSDGFL